MRKTLDIVVALAVLALVFLAPAAAEPGASRGKRIGAFTADTLADGIHLLRPDDGDSARTNSLVVEREDGVLVIDAQPTPSAARELLQAIAQLTAKPVRFLVLSHPHADAAGGASAFPRDVLVIGTGGCKDALADATYDFGAEAKARSGAAWKEPQRRLPTGLPASELLLDDPRNPVEILPILAVPSHSAGDLIVWIRGAGLVAVGDLVPPTKALWTKGADLGSWNGVLNSILLERPKVIAPLRGPTVGPREARLLRDVFAWVRGRVEQELVDHVPLEEIPARILAVPEISRYFPEEVPRPTVRAVIEEAVAEAERWKKKHGFD